MALHAHRPEDLLCFTVCFSSPWRQPRWSFCADRDHVMLPTKACYFVMLPIRKHVILRTEHIHYRQGGRLLNLGLWCCGDRPVHVKMLLWTCESGLPKPTVSPFRSLDTITCLPACPPLTVTITATNSPFEGLYFNNYTHRQNT